MISPHQSRQFPAWILAVSMAANLAGCASPRKLAVADTVYTHGYVYTVDPAGSVAEAIAVRDGRIARVGSTAAMANLIGPTTKVVDLEGRMVMPGLIDAHLHALDGGTVLQACNLDYMAMDVAEFQRRIQACLDSDTKSAPDAWLAVSNWYRQAMLPAGANPSRATLDALHTTRPIWVQSSDGHSLLVNSKALALAGIDNTSRNPAGGSIVRDAAGAATGILEDEAGRLVLTKLPVPNTEDNAAAARMALRALAKQGVTTFFSASASEAELTAFNALQKRGELTVRAYFAPHIGSDLVARPTQAVAWVKDLAQRFDQGPPVASPGIAVRHAKLYMDGVLQAPAMTAALLEPYWLPQGDADKGKFAAGTTTGQLYVSAAVLDALLIELARAGFDLHIHAIGDRAVRQSLDAISVMRERVADPHRRPALAHCELVDPGDYTRFAALDATPVMSFQWGKLAPDTVTGAKDYLGPSRFARMEPEGSLAEAGARIAFGSDWPVDPLNEWFALKVGITRTADPRDWGQFPGRFNSDPGLSRTAALRAATINAAYTLHLERDAGSLEEGKLADLIVLDRNFFTVEPEDIANTKVLLTLVGGKETYRADGF